MKPLHFWILCAIVAVLFQTSGCFGVGEVDDSLRGGNIFSSEDTSAEECLPDGFSGLVFIIQTLAFVAFGYGAREILPTKKE